MKKGIVQQHTHDFGVLRLLGGNLSIDFVNTVEDRTGENPEEFLTTYADLVWWGRHAGYLTDGEVGTLIELASENARQSASVFRRAVSLREALYRTLRSIAEGREPSPSDLEGVQREYESAIEQSRLVRHGDHMEWDWRASRGTLELPLRPVALSAIGLLTEGDLRRVKVCANPYGCGWLFYDSSKNRSRRWCSMEGCGSRVKMRRQYAKRRAESSGRT